MLLEKTPRVWYQKEGEWGAPMFTEHLEIRTCKLGEGRERRADCRKEGLKIKVCRGAWGAGRLAPVTPRMAFFRERGVLRLTVFAASR